MGYRRRVSMGVAIMFVGFRSRPDDHPGSVLTRVEPCVPSFRLHQ